MREHRVDRQVAVVDVVLAREAVELTALSSAAIASSAACPALSARSRASDSSSVIVRV
ncbi:hypothetical protein [Sandaracinus amylolyticus]|uniref:hypothetical protein n=1 Tax=Sandaracinus amylolyticus TaxID=927083 RepID=UPI001F40D8C8|nr:hypothetical protein [Sandaracinus amylolyticus]